MNKNMIGGKKKKVTNILGMAVLLLLFVAYMFPFLMVVINSLKQKRDIIKSPFSWLFTIKGLSFDNFVKAFTQMDFMNAFKNSFDCYGMCYIIGNIAGVYACLLYREKPQQNIEYYVCIDGGIYDYSFPGNYDSFG